MLLKSHLCFGRLTHTVRPPINGFCGARIKVSLVCRRDLMCNKIVVQGICKSIEVNRGSENVFEDLGFNAEEAANLKVRADLMLDLRNYIEEIKHDAHRTLD